MAGETDGELLGRRFGARREGEGAGGEGQREDGGKSHGDGEGGRAPWSPGPRWSAARYFRRIGHAIDGAVVVVGNEQRSVLHDLHVDGTADVIVVLDEAGDEGLYRFDGAVLVERRHDDVAADLLGLVPGAVAGDEDRVPVFGREHVSGVEAHAERRAVRSQERHGLRELLHAIVAPAELLVRQVALMAIREAEIVLAGLGETIELVL